ncbi:hypothetical protein LSAJ156_460013 [Latilactobacillus sakei]|nr:hypothetical protein LSAJ156_460013 [Latilactobacillus sakei]SOB40876.1 hypothetical protein LSAJ160_290039 [Latilactobacillus sakei]SON70229.1 protein of unknown function [Latilactobacillus sakei]
MSAFLPTISVYRSLIKYYDLGSSGIKRQNYSVINNREQSLVLGTVFILTATVLFFCYDSR